MNPDPIALEAQLMRDWIATPLRDELAEWLIDETAAGTDQKIIRDYVWEKIAEWAFAFLMMPGRGISELNIRMMQHALLPDVVARANEMIKEMKEKHEE